jgi:hypothetical protein
MKNPTLSTALKLLKEWQSQLGKGDRPDIDEAIKELEKANTNCLLLNVPRGEVTALLVAINKHACDFLESASKEKAKPNCEHSIAAAWTRHGTFLNSLKADIKRQAGTT